MVIKCVDFMAIGFLYILKNIHLYFFLALYINSRGYIFYIYKTVPFIQLSQVDSDNVLFHQMLNGLQQLSDID